MGIAGIIMALLTFTGANEYLGSKVAVPTAMKSAELALSPEFNGKVKMHAFFSAQVTQANVLEEFKRQAESVARGEMGYNEARNRMQSFLAAQGVGQVELDKEAEGYDPKAAGMSNIASTRRIELILRQNVDMARSVGRKQVSESPGVVAAYPYYRYIARMDKRTRAEHAKLNNLVLPKDDPFWATHTPPWEFGCRCDLEDCDEEEAAKYGIGTAVTKENPEGGADFAQVDNPETGPVNVNPPESGFVFRPAEAMAVQDMSLVQKVEARREILARMESILPEDQVLKVTSTAPVDQASQVMPLNLKEIRGLVEKVAAGKLPEQKVSLGDLLPEHVDAIGLPPTKASISYTSPGVERQFGVAHNLKNHDEVAADAERTLKIWANTIWNTGARVKYVAKGKMRRMVLLNVDTNEIAVLIRKGEGWDLEMASTWDKVPKSYLEENELV